MTDDRSPAEIEREIEEERHALARSLEELQDTFSPERLMNQATSYMRDNGGEFADRFVAQVKANPIAATMAGLGVAWLLASSTRKTAPIYDRNRHTHDPHYMGRSARTLAQTPSVSYDDRDYPAAPGHLSRAPYSGQFDARLDAADGSSAADPSMWDRAKAKAGEMADGVRDMVSDAKDGASDTYRSATASAGDAYRSATASATDAYGTAASNVERGYDATRDGAARAYGATASGLDRGMNGARNGWSDMQGMAADRWGSASDATSRAWQEWQGSARARVESARGHVRDAQGRLYARSTELRSRLAEGTEGMSEQARLRVMRARQAAADAQSDMEVRMGEAMATGRKAYDDQPLIGGLIAAGLGAALGAMLPRTDVEDEYIGAYRDRAFDEADAVFREEATKLRAVAEVAMDEAKAVADEKMEGVKSAVSDAKSATPTGRDAVAKAEGEAKSVAQRVADAARAEAERQNLGGAVKAEAAKVEDAAKDAGRQIN